MLYEGLLSVRLPTRPGPTVSEPWMRSLETLWYTGTWRSGPAWCTHPTAWVLARLSAVGRQLELPHFEVRDDAEVQLSLTAPAPGAEPDAAELPARWTEEPCALQLRTSWTGQGITGLLSLRYTPRVTHLGGALVGAVRVAWLPDTCRTGALEQALASGATPLREAVHGHGRHHTARIAAALEDSLQAPVHWQGSTRVVEVGDGEVDWWPDLDAAARAGMEASWARCRSAGRWPARAADGALGRLEGGNFVTVAEVLDAV